MTNIVPRKSSFSISNLKGGLSSVGSGSGGGGGGLYMSVAHKTGAITVGRQEDPWERDWRCCVRVETIRYGYYEFPQSGAPDKTNMVAMVTGAAKPLPSEPYAKYPAPGPRDMVEMQLTPMEGPFKGQVIEFAPTSVSSQNRIGDLIDAIVRQSELPGGRAGFSHPVIEVFSDFWTGDYGDIYHFSYAVVDWLDDSGEVLQSQWDATGRIEGGTEGFSTDGTPEFMKPGSSEGEVSDSDVLDDFLS